MSVETYYQYLDRLVLLAHNNRGWWHRTIGTGKFGPENCISCMNIVKEIAKALNEPPRPYEFDSDEAYAEALEKQKSEVMACGHNRMKNEGNLGHCWTCIINAREGLY